MLGGELALLPLHRQLDAGLGVLVLHHFVREALDVLLQAGVLERAPDDALRVVDRVRRVARRLSARRNVTASAA